jgi:TolB-like protein
MQVKTALFILVLAFSAGCTSKKGRIKLNTEPEGAEVYVGGTKVGETPTSFDYDCCINQELLIVKDGYHPVKETLNKYWLKYEYNYGRFGKKKLMIDGKKQKSWLVITSRKLEKRSANESHTVAPNAKLAVMDLKAKYGVIEELAEGLSVVIRDTIQGMGDYEVLSKEDVEVIAKRTAIRQSLGCDDTKCLIDIGKSLGTKYMVAGAISKFGDTYIISLRLLNTMGEDTGVKRRINRECKCVEDLLIQAARGTARQLLE